MSVLRYANFKLRDRLLKGEEPAWLKRHSRRAYIVRCVLATVAWGSLAEIRRLDKIARARSKTTGQRWVLDHVIPLTHKYVCGLNIPANLQIIPAGMNARKSNHWTEAHGEFFTEPEQFSLWPVNTPNSLRPDGGGGGGVGAGVVGPERRCPNRLGSSSGPRDVVLDPVGLLIGTRNYAETRRASTAAIAPDANTPTVTEVVPGAIPATGTEELVYDRFDISASHEWEQTDEV